MAETESVIFKVENGVGWIIFNRPEARNALNAEMRETYLASLQPKSSVAELLGEIEIVRCEHQRTAGGEKARDEVRALALEPFVPDADDLVCDQDLGLTGNRDAVHQSELHTRRVAPNRAAHRLTELRELAHERKLLPSRPEQHEGRAGVLLACPIGDQAGAKVELK